MDNIIQLKITLQNTKPPIWRRVLVSKQDSFLDLHYIIQIAMGWENEHLFEFKINENRIGIPDGDWGDDAINASDVSLDSIISGKQKFKYWYDFGDDWFHNISVEKFLPYDAHIKYPFCVDGQLNCPPEDCGGIYGYYNMLEIIRDKKHPEHESMLEWVGDEYNPESFDKESINKHLAQFGKPAKKRKK